MRFLSDIELANLRPAEAATTPLPLPTQVVSNGEYTPLPRSESQREVEARIEAHALELAPRHGMTRREFLASSAGMAAAFLAMNEVFGPVFMASRAEAATAGLAEERSRALRLAVHHRLPDPLRARRLRPAAAAAGSALRQAALEPGTRRRGQPHPLQVPEFPEGDLHRQRHQGGADLGHAHRRGGAPVPEQRPDRRGAGRGQRDRGLAPSARPRHRDARCARLVRRGGSRARDAEAAQPQGLHDRRSDLPDQEEQQLAHGRRDATSIRSTRRCSTPASGHSASTRG